MPTPVEQVLLNYQAIYGQAATLQFMAADSPALPPNIWQDEIASGGNPNLAGLFSAQDNNLAGMTPTVMPYSPPSTYSVDPAYSSIGPVDPYAMFPGGALYPTD